MSLGFSKPPGDILVQQLFVKMSDRVKEIVSKQGKGFPGAPLLKLGLTENQWFKLHELHAELTRDYKLRREMLLTRLDVTILSFTVTPVLHVHLYDNHYRFFY